MYLFWPYFAGWCERRQEDERLLEPLSVSFLCNQVNGQDVSLQGVGEVRGT